MFKKSVLVAVVAVLILSMMLMSVPAVLAGGGSQLAQVFDKDSGNWVTCFADGRINGCTLDEPVAIFYSSTSVPALDAHGQIKWNSDGGMAYTDVLTGIEMWGLASGYSNLIKVIEISTTEIRARIAAAGGADTVLAEGYGYTLGHSATGYFWVTAPNGYSFVWKATSLLG
jgi:hypothetical protein